MSRKEPSPPISKASGAFSVQVSTRGTSDRESAIVSGTRASRAKGAAGEAARKPFSRSEHAKMLKEIEEDFLRGTNEFIKQAFHKRDAYLIRRMLSVHHSTVSDLIKNLSEDVKFSYYGTLTSGDLEDAVRLHGKSLDAITCDYRIADFVFEKLKTKDSSSRVAPAPFAERLAKVAQFAKQADEKETIKYASILLPELGGTKKHVSAGPTAGMERSLPTVAPATWKDDKQPGETPPEFIQRIYGEWMGKGLTLAEVRRLDKPLAQSYYYHLRKGRPLPEGFDLPTKPQQIDRELDQIQAGRAVLGEFTAREARRLSSALGRRGK